MKYSAAVQSSFQKAVQALPDCVAQDVNADRYKYLTDVSLILANHGKSHGSFLDVGGARGANCFMLRHLGDFDLALVDRFDLHEHEAKTGVPHPTEELYARSGIEVRNADVRCEPLPYADATFDVVSAVDLVEHFPSSPKLCLSEIHRVLKPGGMILFGCPNFAHLQTRLKVIFGGSAHTDIRNWHNAENYCGHMREYTRVEVEWLLRESGFRDLQTRMGEEELLSVIRDKQKLQRQRVIGASTSLDLLNAKDAIFFAYASLYFSVVSLVPSFRYFIRTVGRK